MRHSLLRALHRLVVTSAGRSITNADLEKYRQARVENENRRQELGLPSMEERQQEVAAIEDRTVEQVRSMRAQEEAYWRSRAEALRAEAAANEAQFGSLRPNSYQVPLYDSFGGFPGFSPFDGVGFGVTGGGRFNRFGRFSPSPFDGFLATPITPFPRFQSNRRPLVFQPREYVSIPNPMEDADHVDDLGNNYRTRDPRSTEHGIKDLLRLRDAFRR